MKKFVKFILLGIPLLAVPITTVGVLASNESISHWGGGYIQINYGDNPGEERKPERPFDDSTKYNYNNLTFRDVVGQHTYKNGTYTSGEGACLSVCETVPFPYGTYEVDFQTVGGTDSGIVFGLDNKGLKDYWEPGISYYWFYVSTLMSTPYLRLVAIYDGVYTELYNSKLTSADPIATVYKMKIIVFNNKILCYGNNKIVFSMKDSTFIEGTKFGFRSDKPGVRYSNVSLTNEYKYE